MLAKVVIALLYFPLSIWVRGSLLRLMWTWFLTPVAHVDAPSIGICLGLTLLIVFPFMTAFAMLQKKDEVKSFTEIVISDVFVNLFTWGLAAIYHLID